MGQATYGGARPDVAAAYGSQFLNSGYGFTGTLGAGYYQVNVYAHSSVTASWSQAQTVYLTVTAGVLAAIDLPEPNQTVGQPFTIAGWALDASSTSGSGVPFLHVWVYLNGTSAVFVGQVDTGGSRPDVAAWLQDSRFTPSGYGLSASGLPPGTHLLLVYPYSAASGFAPAVARWITVQ